jgi:hypothetical protein
MQPQTPTGPSPIATVTMGMTVVDANGEEAGTVSAMQMPGTDVRPDAPAGVAEELMTVGYVRVAGAGHLSNDTYAGGHQIRHTVEGRPGVVNLNVSWEELYRA